MKTNKKIVQLSLIFIGLFLILATYVIYPKIHKKADIDDRIGTDSSEHNIFENVEYRGVYENGKPFAVKAEKALILVNEPNVVYMTNMRVALSMNDGRTIIITSNKGRYNKVSYDCFFENNVKALDGETTVLAENLDLLASEDSATVYNDVFLTNDSGSLRADKVYYDFETKYYQVSMFSNQKVKIKLIK